MMANLPGSRRPMIRVLRQETLYTGRVIQLVREVLDMGGRRVTREVIQHPGAVVIVPLRSPSQILFVRQYRRAVDRELLELPAGTLERGERRVDCARRELLEETGWRARRMRRLGQFYAAPGVLSEQLTVFVAQGLTYVGAAPEADEAIRPVTLSLRTALAKIRSGALCDAKSIIGVLFAARLLRDRRLFAS